MDVEIPEKVWGGTIPHIGESNRYTVVTQIGERS